MKIRIVGIGGPGRTFGDSAHTGFCYENVHIGIQRGKDVIEMFPGDSKKVVWEFESKLVEKATGLDATGDFIQGRLGDRFIYLSWGVVDDKGRFNMFRRVKVMLAAVDEQMMRQAAQEVSVLTAELPLTAADGSPICAAVRPPVVSWSVRKA